MEFRDLKRQYTHLKPAIDANIEQVISSTQFISGEQVSLLESRLAQDVGVRHCISCGNGTDAITIAFLAHGVGEGDGVFVPDFTFFSSGECPAGVGATPVFVDVSAATYNIDCESLRRAVETVLAQGSLKPRAVIAVDLFGLPADYDALRSVCEEYGLLLLEDGAQGFGGMYRGRRACSFGDISPTSFFPAKPLGCYGDGGAIFTDDDHIADLCRSIAVHGKSTGKGIYSKYDNVRIGMNSRLDTLQAAILLPKLEAFQEYELDHVNRAAALYTEKLQGTEGLVLPAVSGEYYSSWAQYTVQLPDPEKRAEVQAYLKNRGIPTMIYYVKPMHEQGAFAGTRSAEANCPVTEELCKSVLCLPIHPYLSEEEIDRTVTALKEALSGK